MGVEPGGAEGDPRQGDSERSFVFFSLPWVDLA